MNVTLIDYTGSGDEDPARYAAALLAFTKNTRLNMDVGTLQEWLVKPWTELDAELKYMANTIPSSWEFVHYTFAIEGVTRAFTHQFVRTRTASFAQQTMRVLDVSGWDYATGPSLQPGNRLQSEMEAFDATRRAKIYHDTMKTIADAYKAMIALGAKVEDARGILPTNILTNITVSMNMRTFVDMVRKRSSSRTQGEYRDVLEHMKVCVRAAHPFIDHFIDRDADRAIKELEEMVMGNTLAIKKLDQLRSYL